MNMMKSSRFHLFVTMTVMLVVCSCGHDQSPVSAWKEKSDSLLTEQADSTVRATASRGDCDRAMILVDSFLDAKQISPIRADMLKFVVHVYKREDQEGYKYLERLCDRCSKTGEEPAIYAASAIQLSSYYQITAKVEEALRVALPAITLLENSDRVASDRKGALFNIIGNCQMILKQYDDANKNFERCYRYYKIYQSEDDAASDARVMVIGLTNIAQIYDAKKEADVKQKWVERADSMLAWYETLPNAMPNFVDRTKGIINLDRAIMLIEEGETEAAAEAYGQFQKSTYATSDQGRINSASYLEMAGRYAEAADIYMDIDRIIGEWDKKLNFENIQNYFFPKLHYNLYAGRKDTALAVALRIDSLVGPAFTELRENQAAELATAYETQKKEAQIVKQQAELSQQRLLGAIIGLGLIALFLTLYLLYYRHSQKRMARMKAAQERIESELRIARDIQMGMVPNTFPQREGLDMFASMTPAKEVGGDLYGYLLEEDRLYFAVGDVSGKGIPASLFMAQATRLFLTLAKQGLMPAEICMRMNDALSGDDNENGMFVTFWLGLLDLKTGHLDFCNAGHNPPVIGGGDSHGDFLDMNANAPIGLWPGLDYEGEEIDSIKGRPLFVYTDGLNEAENMQQERFGDERLLTILRHTHFDSAQQVIDTLRDEVERHRNGAEPNDDLTMMCLRVS